MRRMEAEVKATFDMHMAIAKARREAYEKKMEVAEQLPEETNEDKYWKMKIKNDITDRYSERK